MPITAIYAGLLGLFFLALATRVVYLRRVHKVAIGYGEHRDLRRAIRVHGNFCEFAPLAVIVLGAVELNGGSPVVVHAIGVAMVLGRALHAYGLSRHHGTSPGRFWGLMLAWTALGVASVLAIWLGTSAASPG